MKFWLYRTQRGDISLHESPNAEYNKISDAWYGELKGYITSTNFSELTFEDSPMEVRLMREDVVNANYQSIADYEDFLGLVSFMRKAQREANDMIAQVECYQEAQDCIKKAEELELMVDKFIEERT